MASLGYTGTVSQPVGPGNLTLNPLTQTLGANTNLPLFQGNGVSGNLGLTGGISPRGPSGNFTPTIQIGQGQANAAGAGIGGALGSLSGGPLGAAAGSALGSALGGGFNKGAKNDEHNRRDAYINKLREIGFLDQDYQFLNADGSVASFQGGSGQLHTFKDPSKQVGGNRNQLYGFESDYTNDLDYIAAMGGITLSRLLRGGKDKSIDQVGNLIGNSALGQLGYGQDFNPQNFNQVADNLRAMYAKAGIKSKDEFLALANQGFSQQRFNDADRAVAQQVAGLIFDKNFGDASTLMSGRQKGLEVASASPPASQAAAPTTRRAHSPVMSFEEALVSVKPIVDYARSIKGKRTGPSGLQNFVSNLRGGADIVRGIGNLYGAVNQLSHGSLGNFLGSAFGGGGTDLASSTPFDFGAGQPDAVGDVANNFSLGSDTLQLDSGGLDFGAGADSSLGDAFNLDSTLDF